MRPQAPSSELSFAGAYERLEDTEALVDGRRGKGIRGRFTLGSVVHLATSHAAKQDLTVDPADCRPGAWESFKPVVPASCATTPDSSGDNDEWPEGLHCGADALGAAKIKAPEIVENAARKGVRSNANGRWETARASMKWRWACASAPARRGGTTRS